MAVKEPTFYSSTKNPPRFSWPAMRAVVGLRFNGGHIIDPSTGTGGGGTSGTGGGNTTGVGQIFPTGIN